MENQNLELKKYILQYGALLGGISVVFGLMLFSLEMHYQNETSTTIVSIAITIGVIAFAQYSYRKDNEGFMSLSQGIKMGLGMAAISGLINVAYFLVLSNVLDPEMMNKALQMGMHRNLFAQSERLFYDREEEQFAHHLSSTLCIHCIREGCAKLSKQSHSVRLDNELQRIIRVLDEDPKTDILQCRLPKILLRLFLLDFCCCVYNHKQ